jgi:hypothetical protein
MGCIEIPIVILTKMADGKTKVPIFIGVETHCGVFDIHSSSIGHNTY